MLNLGTSFLKCFFFPAFYYAFLIVEENMTVLVHYHSYCSVNYKKHSGIHLLALNDLLCVAVS